MSESVPTPSEDAPASAAATAGGARRRRVRTAIVTAVLLLVFVVCRAMARALPFVPVNQRPFWDLRDTLVGLSFGAIYALLTRLFRWVGDNGRRRAIIWGLAAAFALISLVTDRAVPEPSGMLARYGLSIAGVAHAVLSVSVLVVLLFPVGWAYEFASGYEQGVLIRFPVRRVARKAEQRE